MKVKKIVALLLVLAMGVSFASCSKAEVKKTQVICLVPTMDATGLMIICNAMGDVMKEKDYTFEIKDCRGNDQNYVTFIENAVTAGNVAVLMVAAQSVDAVQDACESAMSAGIKVLMLGARPTAYKIDALIITSYALTGYYAVQAAENWISQNKADLKLTDGKVPVAVNTYYDIEDGKKRSDAMIGELGKSADAYVFNEKSFYGDSAQTDGYDWAETCMTANKDLRVFLCYEPDAMKGVCSYLEEYAKDNGLDLKNFCVINCYEDADTPAALKQAQDAPSSTAFKGYVTYGAAPDVTGQTLAKLALGSLDGTYEHGYEYIDVINAYTSFGYTAHWEDGMENLAEAYE